MAAYSRDMEREADSIGQRICAAAGYDPVAMSTFMRSLDRRERLLIGRPRVPTWRDTHPGTRERAAENSVRASEMRWTRDPALGDVRKRYLDRIDGLVIGDRPETGIFFGQLFVHPGLDFQIRFPEGWQLQNTARAVGAMEPRRAAAVFLAGDLLAGELVEVANEFARQADQEFGARVTQKENVRLGTLEAVRYSFQGGSGGQAIAAQVTFFPFARGTWRMVAMSSPAARDRFSSTMLVSTRSFGPLTPENRERIEIRRLRVVLARSGEEIGALGQRTQCVLDPAETASLNGLFGNEVFAGDELLKIVRLEGKSGP
jgi:predicted Zn-dependent protease